MTLWLKARRTPWVAASAAAAAVLLVAVGNLTVSLPVFGSLYGVRMPVALLAPLIVVVMLALGLASGDPRLEAVAARPIALLDLGLVATATGSLALLCWAIQMVDWSGLGTAAARNAIGLSGMMLLGTPLGMRVAAIVPVAFLVFLAAFGDDGTGNPAWWAWPVAPEASGWSWAIAALLSAAGLGVAWRAAPTLELGSE